MTAPTLTPKHYVAEHAVKLVENGMTVGLGTGSTANLFIDAIARRFREEELQVRVVASSLISALRAQQAGLAVLALDQLTGLDLYIDGADEVTPDLTLLKGRGQDLVAEKLLASSADAFYVLVDDSKLVKQIGDNFPIPVEVIPSAWQLVRSTLQKYGGSGELRLNASGDNVFFTASGSVVLDMQFADMPCEAIVKVLTGMPGVVEHGIFSDVAKAVLVGTEQGVNVLSN